MSFTPGKLTRGRAETRSRTKDDVRRVMQAVDKVKKKKNILSNRSASSAINCDSVKKILKISPRSQNH